MSVCKTDLELRLFSALKRIAAYQPPEKLKRNSLRDWGLDDGNEALEYAYENVLSEAKHAVKGIRALRKPPAPPNKPATEDAR